MLVFIVYKPLNEPLIMRGFFVIKIMTEQNLVLSQIDSLVGEGRLSRKLTNRMKSTFDASQLSLVGGRFTGETIKARHLMPALTSMIHVPIYDPLKEASFNTTLPKIAETLVVGNDDLRARNYIDAIGGEDFTNLPSVAVDLSLSGDSETGIVFRTVFGATEEMPLRALSYLVPALVLQDDFREKGVVPPQLQVVFANHFSSAVNSMNYEKVKEQTSLFSLVAREYITQFFPELADRVVFLEDVPLEKHFSLRKELDRYTTILASSEGEIKADLVRKGFNSDLDDSLLYGAAHVLFHDANPQGLLNPISSQPDYVSPTTIINIGGAQEKFFYHLRQSLKDAVGVSDQVRTLQLFTRHHVPPYYLAQGGDISLADVINGESLPTEIARAASYDLNYLNAESNRRGDFGSFLENLGDRRRGR